MRKWIPTKVRVRRNYDELGLWGFVIGAYIGWMNIEPDGTPYPILFISCLAWTLTIEFPQRRVQFTAETCPGRPCADGCDHVQIG